MSGFNPRLPGGRRRRDGQWYAAFVVVSIHAFRGEGDLRASSWQASDDRFQSTPSGGKATGIGRAHNPVIGFQSTPSGGKATGERRRLIHHTRVSIHAFRGEGDGWCMVRLPQTDVSIHAFRGEGDTRARHCRRCTDRFQSTPSGGKATRIKTEIRPFS